MQTLTIEVKDELIADVIKTLEKFKDNIKIKSNKNLEIDPYFYERREKLNKILQNVENKESNLISFEEFEVQINKLEKELERKYAN